MSELIQGVNKVVKDLLPTSPIYYDQSKFINDPIWGIIELYDYELTIIDTPLFQRLRYIHQTGFTFFTYPTAHHARFEHSLGVVNIATKIFNVLKGKHQIKDETLPRIRLAALLHDAGHSAFSHTSEEFYSSLADIKNFIDNSPKLRSKGAGEVLSHLIITSEAFTDFFNKLKTQYGERLNNINIEDVANLVVGKPVSLEYGFEADIISGPIDADKLDYFPRDGRAAGIDISLDIHRLINCVEIQTTNYSGTPRQSLVINRRGYNALQQLLFARATLTASVYHHHKVRACDSMLKNVMESYNEENISFKKCIKHAEGIKLNETPNFLYITDLDFKSELSLLESNSIRYKLLNDLFNRNLFKRVLKISLQTVTTAAERGQNDGTYEKIQSDLAEFFTLRKKPEVKKKLVKAIYDKFSSGEINFYDIAFDIPHKPNFEKAGDAPINNSSIPGKPEMVTLKSVIPITDWIKGYERFFGHAYIFGPANIGQRIKLAIAAAHVLKSFKPYDEIEPFNFFLRYEAIAEDIRDAVKEQTKSLNLFRE